jgi:hypothetical protein
MDETTSVAIRPLTSSGFLTGFYLKAFTTSEYFLVTEGKSSVK